MDVEYTESVLSESFEADLVKDMLSLLAVFSAKLYSQRGRENRKKRKQAVEWIGKFCECMSASADRAEPPEEASDSG